MKIAKIMAMADGEMSNNEKAVIREELRSFGIEINSTMYYAIDLASEVMEGKETLIILSKMTEEQKKYVYGYLLTLMVANGDNMDSDTLEKQHSVLSVLTEYAQFPTIEEWMDAIQYYQDNTY